MIIYKFIYFKSIFRNVNFEFKIFFIIFFILVDLGFESVIKLKKGMVCFFWLK